MRGLPPFFWQIYVSRWMHRAFICRYGSVSIYDLLGRDPRRDPLSPLELHIFAACLEEHVVAERKPFVELGVPAPED